jgi:tRNA(Arg) A34 adenosine deaminase TadA
MFKCENPKILSLLEKEASKSDFEQHKHAACIVHKGKIIAIGRNKRKSHPTQAKYSKNKESIYLHAELDAIIRAVNRFGTEVIKESDIYVLRLTRNGKHGHSKPCAGCAKAIDAFGLKGVYWT